MKQKIAEFSFLHVFAILLVVLGHSFYQTNSLIVDWMYQFHVPLFFFVSGYLFNVSVNGKPLQPHIFLSRKAVRLLLPYFALSTLLFGSFIAVYGAPDTSQLERIRVDAHLSLPQC